jgi:hypothetical protein
LENLNIENVVQSDIDTLVGKIGEISVSSAKKTFGIAGKPFKNKKIKVCISSKPWFGVDCKFARQHYRKLKQKCKTNNTEEMERERFSPCPIVAHHYYNRKNLTLLTILDFIF